MAKITPEYEKYILSSIKDIEYGSVVITLHAGKVAQVEITEKYGWSLIMGRDDVYFWFYS